MDYSIDEKPVKIEITFSNDQATNLGVKIGDQFDAIQLCFNGIAKSECIFSINGNSLIAFNCQHDEDALILVTTCKILKK